MQGENAGASIYSISILASLALSVLGLGVYVYRERERDWGLKGVRYPLQIRVHGTLHTSPSKIISSLHEKTGEYSIVCSDSPDILVYNRIDKAGSSTTMDIIKKLSKMNNFTVITPMPYHDHNKLRKALFAAIESGQRTVIMNHFDFPELIYSSKVAYINVMRDPVERFISEYYYLRLLRRGKLGEQYRAAHGNLSLEECIFGQSDFSGRCLGRFNVMAHYFCGMESSLCHANDTWLRVFSQQHLDSIYTVGVIEDLRASLKMFETKFPTFFKNASNLPIVKQNGNGGESRQENGNVLNYLTKMHEIDYLLYDKAKVKLNRYLEHCVS